MAWLLRRFARWALSRQSSAGGYRGEDDPRWAYTIETLGDKYLTRVILFKCRWFGIYLHNFHRPDSDRFMHNHPWKWAWSFLLSGSYNERRLVRVEDYRPLCSTTIEKCVVDRFSLVRWWNKLTHRNYHAVQALHGDVWTLFVVGPRCQDWGFLVDGEHVPWKEYLEK